MTQEASAAGRALALLRKRSPAVCQLRDCGHAHREFLARAGQLYCCHAHAALASWRRQVRA